VKRITHLWGKRYRRKWILWKPRLVEALRFSDYVEFGGVTVSTKDMRNAIDAIPTRISWWELTAASNWKRFKGVSRPIQNTREQGSAPIGSLIKGCTAKSSPRKRLTAWESF